MSSSGTICNRRAERGFVLATTLLVTTLLTVMLAASFLLVSAEQRTTDNSFGTAKALVLAQAGLQNYFSRNRGLAVTDSADSMRITLTGGYADVVARRVRQADTLSGNRLSLWVVKSSGVATTGVMAGQAQGTRTIAQLAQLNLGVLPARAAMVAINGVYMIGPGTNPLAGSPDYNCWPRHDTTAVTVPTGGYSNNSGSGWPTTSWPHQIVENLGTAAAVRDSTGIDWPSLVGGNLTPDYTLTPGSSWRPSGTSWTTIGYVPGDLALLGGATGYGVLVVTGNLSVSGSAEWHGVILVGGRLREPGGSSQSYQVYGSIVTGLNTSLGMYVAPDTLNRKGSSDIQWSSCYVAQTASGMSSMVPIKNAWADTWSTY